MYIALTIVLCLFSISFHELGHAWANYIHRIPMRQINLIGFKSSFLPSYRTGIRLPYQRMPAQVMLHPLVLGASVRPESYAFSRLSSRDQAFIFGAGPFASLLYTLIMWSIAVSIDFHHYPWWMLPALLALTITMVVFNKIFCRYIVAVLGVALLGLVIFGMLSNLQHAADSMGGPVTVVQEGTKIYSAQAANDHQLFAAFYLAGALSFAIGTTNMLPLVPFDGGQIVRIYLSKFNVAAGKRFATWSFYVFLGLILLAFSKDIRLLIG